jgi:hypothetical protein
MRNTLNPGALHELAEGHQMVGPILPNVNHAKIELAQITPEYRQLERFRSRGTSRS